MEKCDYETEIKENPLICFQCKRRKDLECLTEVDRPQRELICFCEGFSYAIHLLNENVKLTDKQKLIVKALEIRLFCDVLRKTPFEFFEGQVLGDPIDVNDDVERNSVWYRV